MSKCIHSLIVIACLAASPTFAQADGAYPKLVDAYMKSDIEALEKLLASDLGALTDEQKKDVAYIRSALAECRPSWWKIAKAGQKAPINVQVWGRPLDVTYDPASKDGLTFSFTPSAKKFVVTWPAGEMDSADKGEYGFLKGDQVAVTLWGRLGMASAINNVDLKAVAQGGQPANLRFNRYIDFRGNLAALYYTTPAARRYALHIYLASFMDKYGKGPLVNTRRAVGAFLLSELLAQPSAYPSLKLPKALKTDQSEQELATHFKHAINRGSTWTIAEDRAFREALKAFAAANDRTVFETQQLTLPNKLTLSLDDKEDAPLRTKRNQWVKAQFDKLPR